MGAIHEPPVTGTSGFMQRARQRSEWAELRQISTTGIHARGLAIEPLCTASQATPFLKKKLKLIYTSEHMLAVAKRRRLIAPQILRIIFVKRTHYCIMIAFIETQLHARTGEKP
jgi:hypothetical protein